MNFFEAQQHAQRQTRLLVALFVLAVLALIVSSNLLVSAAIAYHSTGYRQLTLDGLIAATSLKHVLINSGLVILVVGAGTLYKLQQLKAGGHIVAEMLGGRLVPRDTRDADLRRLLNIVDEMAIASGMPVPPVYLLRRERGINAFAAGTTPQNAVIGITVGTLRELDRDQLQGVIGHEFSHIASGDMALNLNLMGVIHGITMIGLIGRLLLGTSYGMGYGMGYRRHSRRSSGGPQMAAGLALMVLGYGGTLLGNLIRAAISRQREFAADAAAIQFTRNRDGIGGALRRIGGLTYGSRLRSPHASEVSHALFGAGVSNFLGSLTATHPPLEERIRRIDPRWDGQFDDRAPTPPPPPEPEQVSGERAMGAVLAAGAALRHSSSQQAVRTSRASRQGAASGETLDGVALLTAAGQPTEAHLQRARELLQQMPPLMREATAEPYGARAVIYALLIKAGAEAAIPNQMAHLEAHADTGVAALTQQLLDEDAPLEIALRLPLIDLALPALRQLSPDQHIMFWNNIEALIRMDGQQSLFEWSLVQVLTRHLRPGQDGDRSSPVPIHHMQPECALVLSLIAYGDGDTDEEAARDFAAGLKHLQLPRVALLPKGEISPDAATAALTRLNRLQPLHKRRLLAACVACIHADGQITAAEQELVRAVGESIDCPLPVSPASAFGA